jgi:ribose 5-phosphate isomerase B
MIEIRKIAVASDHAGFTLKERIKPYLQSKELEIKDLGTCSKERCDYPAFAYALAKEVSIGRVKRGILICKSGIGNSIVANKLPRVRAALCYNIKSARLSREHNDSNILVLGSAFVNLKLAKKIIGVWLKTEFQGGRHKRRVNQIIEIEKKITRKSIG